MSFDVIGRREYVFALLNLPSVLKHIVDEYNGYDIVPSYSIPILVFPAKITSVFGENIICRTDPWTLNDTPLKTSFYTYAILHVKDNMFVFCGPWHLEIRDVATNECVLLQEGHDMRVCDEMVYYIDNSWKAIWRYDVTTRTQMKIKEFDVAVHMYQHHNTIHFHGHIESEYWLMQDDKSSEIPQPMQAMMEVAGIRYFVCAHWVMGTNLQTIYLPEKIIKCYLTEGFIVLKCLTRSFIVDIKRWCHIEVDLRGYIFKNVLMLYKDQHLHIFK